MRKLHFNWQNLLEIPRSISIEISHLRPTFKWLSIFVGIKHDHRPLFWVGQKFQFNKQFILTPNADYTPHWHLKGFRSKLIGS